MKEQSGKRKERKENHPYIQRTSVYKAGNYITAGAGGDCRYRRAQKGQWTAGRVGEQDNKDWL